MKLLIFFLVMMFKRYTSFLSPLSSSFPLQASSPSFFSLSSGSMLPKDLQQKHSINGEEPTEADIKSITERQLEHKVSSMLFVEKEKCKFGFPRAFIQKPISEDGKGISSGMIRLTCPHLVKGIDQLEAEGMVEIFNKKVLQSSAVVENFKSINMRWRNLRIDSMSKNDDEIIIQKFGKEDANKFVNSGIIGVMRENDVKCLHAHVADHLFFGDNQIGQETIKELEKRGISKNGCDNCFEQCDPSFQRTSSSFWYLPVKNNQKLRAQKNRRNALKLQSKQKIAVDDTDQVGLTNSNSPN